MCLKQRMKLLCLTILILLLCINVGCNHGASFKSPNFNERTKRFEHPDGVAQEKSFSSIVSFALEYFTRERDIEENTGFPVIHRTKEQLDSFKENVMWIGHSTLLLNHSNLTVLTDPHLSERASPLTFLGPKRVTPQPLGVADLPPVDVVVISHNHYDHLDAVTIKSLVQLQPNVKFLVPLGLKHLVEKWGAIAVQELDWWEKTKVKGVVIQPTPVQHWSKRTAFDRNKTLWSGWMLQWPDFSFFFAGDSGYSNDFKTVTEKLGAPTLAAIPIGAYEPRHFMKVAHLNPREAVQVFQDLNAKYAIGIHWGTFKLTLEPMQEPQKKLTEELKGVSLIEREFRTLKHGETWPKIFLR